MINQQHLNSNLHF